MQPGALRALEFDRIVEAVTRLRADADGRRAPRAARAVDRPAEGRAAAGRDDRDGGTWRRTRRFRCARRASCRRFSRRWPSKGRALEALRLLALATFLDSVDESRAAIRRAPGIVSAARSRQRRRRVVQGRDGADARQDRPVGRGRRSREPGAEAHPRPAAQAALAAARHARVVPARQGHGEVSAGPGRHRAQRPLRARRQGRASQRRFPASCTARRPAARACFSSRSAPSKSTTTSSRSRSRKPRRSGASCSR